MMFFGGDFVAQFFGDLLPAPAVTQRDRDRALGFALTDDVAIEFGNNFARSEALERAHGRVTTLILSLV